MQKLATRRGSQAFALALAIALVAALMALACPTRAFAADTAAKQVAHAIDSSGKTVATYTSVADAVKDCTVDSGKQDSKTLVMDDDWNTTEILTVADSKALTIDMNGKKITGNGDDSVFRLYENSSLTLKSSSSYSFSYKGYDGSNGKKVDCYLTTGGLVTGGSSSDAGAVRMDANSTLTLDKVALAGNYGDGAISTREECSIYMRNGAEIKNNKGDTGGITVIGADTNIHMDNASIHENYGRTYGGGIYSKGNRTGVFMTSGSSIYDNTAKCAGGGIYFTCAHFNVESSDNTGSIKNNKAIDQKSEHTTDDGDEDSTHCGGAGIYINNDSFSEHEGTIKGLTISGNEAGDNAGAIYVDQAYTRIIDCTISDNKSSSYAGGVYLNADYCSLTNCSVTGNTASKDAGGIYVNDSNCSLTSCTITGNACGGSNEGGGVYVKCKYDITLLGKCTITGNTRNGGSADDLFLGTSLTSQSYILNGVDEGSSVGIRTGSTDESEVIGEKISTYTEGTYFMDLDDYRVIHTSGHDGDLVQLKVTPISDLTITVKAPKTDEKFPTKATLSWGDDSSKEVAIAWYDANTDSEVSGTAQHDGKYYFKLAAGEDPEPGLVFDSSLTADNVHLVVKDNKWNAGIKYAHVDDSRVLNVTTGIIEAADPEVYGGDDDEKASKASGASSSESAETEQTSATGSGAALVQTGDSLPMGVFAIVSAGAMASVAVGAFALRRSRR